MEDANNNNRQAGQETGIFANNFGGLNTTASAINCPYEDSPALYNMDINVSGKVSKRKGTKHLATDTSIVNTGVGLLSFVTGLRYPYLIEKRGTGLYVYEVNNDVITLVMSKTNVWSSVAATVKPTYARTTEVEPRIIICTGVNQPVQLRFVEQQGVASGSGSNYALSNATRFEHSALTNTIVYKNRTRVTPSSIVYGAGTLTLNGVSYTDGDVIDVIMVTWQHMVEALYLKGNRVSAGASVYTASLADQNIEIPTSLRYNLLVDYPTTPYHYGIICYISDAWDLSKVAGTQFSYATGLNPSTNTEYAFGDGSRYITGSGTVTPSPLFVTLGAKPATESKIFMARRIDLLPWFNGGVALAGTSYKVYIDGTLKTQHTNSGAGSSTFGDYYMFDTAGAVNTSTSTTCRFISWEAGLKMGAPSNAAIEIINPSTSYIGSSATTDVHLYKDGACAPLYGIGAYFDYSGGSFARNVTIFENRLVFSGILSNPLTILFSEQGDTKIPLRPYRDFQIDEENTLATSPFNVPIQGKADDFVTGLTVWQNSMFVFSRQSVYRVSGIDSGLSNTGRNIRLISSLGLVNPFSVVSTDTGILYLTDIGVYLLRMGVDSNDFAVEEVSIKIRSLFGITKNPAYEPQSFLAYDPVEQRVYVGMPTTTSTAYCSKLYIFNTYRSSWSEYRTDGGFNFLHIAMIQDFSLGLELIGSYYAGATTRYLIKFNDSQFVDFRKTYTGDAVTTDFTLVFNEPVMSTTTIDTVQGYSCTPYFDMIENTQLEDVYVTLDSVAQTFGTDYIKRAYNQIYLLNNPGAGKTLRVVPRSFATDYEATQAYYGISTPIANHIPIHVTVDNAIRYQAEHYTFTTPATVAFLTAPPNDSVISIGKMYKAYYKTPMISLNSLAALKRIKHLYVYFDNEIGNGQFVSSDVNSSSSQTADEIVGRYKIRMNANVAVEINSDWGQDVDADVYGFYSLVFDDTLFDITPSHYQYRRYTLFKEALQGVGCLYSAVIFSYDEGSFTVVAYQITNRIGAEKHINFGG